MKNHNYYKPTHRNHPLFVCQVLCQMLPIWHLCSAWLKEARFQRLTPGLGLGQKPDLNFKSYLNGSHKHQILPETPGKTPGFTSQTINVDMPGPSSTETTFSQAIPCPHPDSPNLPQFGKFLPAQRAQRSRGHVQWQSFSRISLSNQCSRDHRKLNRPSGL